jgi:hypothetical protein
VLALFEACRCEPNLTADTQIAIEAAGEAALKFVNVVGPLFCCSRTTLSAVLTMTCYPTYCSQRDEPANTSRATSLGANVNNIKAQYIYNKLKANIGAINISAKLIYLQVEENIEGTTSVTLQRTCSSSSSEVNAETR